MTTRKTDRIRTLIVVLLLSVGVLPNAAKAVLIDVIATGTVTEVVGATLMTQFSVGQSMSMTITYDADSVPGSSLILTQALYSGAITGGNFTVETYIGSIFGGNINIENDDPVFFDGITFRGFATGLDVGGLSLNGAGMVFDDPTAMTLSSLALPLTTADLTAFPEQTLGLSFGSAIGTTPPGVTGRFTSLELVVRETIPEPPVVALMTVAFGILSIGSLRRRVTQRIF